MLPVNYRSWQRSFSKLPNSCQQLELTLLSTADFRAIKILLTVWVDIPVDRSFQSYQNPDNFNNWRSCSLFRATKNLEDTMPPVKYGSWQRNFQSYLRPGRRYICRQLLKLTTVAFRATTFLSTVGVDICDCSFQSYLKIEDAMLPVSCLSW